MSEVIARIYVDSMEWQPDEPDGSCCAECGDACYLSMWRLAMWYRVVFGNRGSGAIQGPMQYSTSVMCGSCHGDEWGSSE